MATKPFILLGLFENLIREEAATPSKKILVGRHIPESTWLRWIGFNFEDSIIGAEKKGLTNTE